MSPVPALVCALLLCGAPPHATGLTDARPAPAPGSSSLASGADGPSAPPILVSDEGGSDLDRPAPTPRSTHTSVRPPEPDAPSTAPAEPGPTRAPDPEPVADPSREDTPVVRYTVASPEPTTAASGVLGHVSTGLLAVLALLVLGLRLSVGWPRFPDPYLGRRRRPSARRCG